MITAHRTAASLDDRAAVTRLILESPVEMSLQAIGEAVGLSPETVKQIRYGVINTDVVPELPRLDLDVHHRRCSECQFFLPEKLGKRDRIGQIPVCDLGIKESRITTYARGCGVFWPAADSSATPPD